ncbi:glycosyltransferase family 4 protein [Phycisphaera mikurensis]|uniref:Putative glycosyltransferase n=1 Tax=Phycisphaera mikurensis (strain NBRC 102666 / KCTC 22515 / FYK2301M01) TaxID=1142394 RepID=I0IA80_PHYMF|nr:glycosyltransferase family 4 protein [Phycisphaera mikurensis]MBB6441830.1 glycosyltransferase involved in cell wall biosynthesis [Phycisphaera mikurensis]BAM02168.1 putative glycosyltransferase [Phycisphaera mikurensis NBRC 102666]
MRVLLETDAVGGVWTFSLALAQALAREGVEAELALVGPDDAGRRGEAEAAGVRVHRLGGPLEWQPGVAGTEALLRQGEDLRSLAAERDASVLHTCTHAHAGRLAGADGLAVVHTGHSDVLTWWRAVHGTRPDARYDAYAAGLRRAVERAEAFVVPSRAYGRALGAATGEARPFRIIPNGVADPGPPAIRSGEPVALAAARFDDPLKNLAVLGRAGERLGPRLRIAGSGTGGPGAGGALGGAALLGNLGRAAMDRELGSAAVFAGPCRFEPFGLAVLEAAAAGCALVLADQPTHRELWDGVAAFVAGDDAEGWAEALASALRDPAATAAAGRAARERSAGYRVAGTARAYASLYREVLERRTGGSEIEARRRSA